VAYPKQRSGFHHREEGHGLLCGFNVHCVMCRFSALHVRFGHPLAKPVWLNHWLARGIAVLALFATQSSCWQM
jgi:hypothetical protein